MVIKMNDVRKQFLVNAQERMTERSFHAEWDVDYNKPWEWMTIEDITDYYTLVYSLQEGIEDGFDIQALSELSDVSTESIFQALQETQGEVYFDEETE